MSRSTDASIRVQQRKHRKRGQWRRCRGGRLTQVLKSANMEYFHRRVREEIENWPVGILADYARIVELLMEFGPNLRMPHSRALGGGLFELRPRGREGIGRALYCYVTGRRVIILHAFVKKTRATPPRDLAVARRRMKEVQNG